MDLLQLRYQANSRINEISILVKQYHNNLELPNKYQTWYRISSLEFEVTDIRMDRLLHGSQLTEDYLKFWAALQHVAGCHWALFAPYFAVIRYGRHCWVLLPILRSQEGNH